MIPLVTENLSVNLADRAVLQQVNMSVQAGELLGLLGPNGAGKSTLLRLLTGLLRPSTGRVLIQGQEVRTVAAKRLARELAYLPQGAECQWAMSVEQIVTLGRLPHRAPWTRLDDKHQQHIHQAMIYADVLHLSERAVNTLSGGEKTRVLLARALAGEPQILLADEPVAGLDPAHQLDVMQLLRRLAEDGAALVVVLHDLTLASRFCHRIVLLNQGQVAAYGTAEQVLSAENLAHCYQIRAYRGQTDQGGFIIPLERLAHESNAS